MFVFSTVLTVPQRYTALGYPTPSSPYHVVGQRLIDTVELKTLFFAAMNVLAQEAMKDAANCETHRELRSSGNR